MAKKGILTLWRTALFLAATMLQVTIIVTSKMSSGLMTGRTTAKVKRRWSRYHWTLLLEETMHGFMNSGRWSVCTRTMIGKAMNVRKRPWLRCHLCWVLVMKRLPVTNSATLKRLIARMTGNEPTKMMPIWRKLLSLSVFTILTTVALTAMNSASWRKLNGLMTGGATKVKPN